MPWYLHLFWGLVVYRAAVELGRGIGTAGEWVGKAIMKALDTYVALEARPGPRRPRP